MIVRVKYYDDPDLPNSLSIYKEGIQSMILKDDGAFPDLVANDYNYAAVVIEDFDIFLQDIADREAKINADGGVYHFEGHDGEFIAIDNIPTFDIEAFNNLQEVQIYQPFLDVSLCEGAILKQNSLFITDLAVVEDPARTYNVYTNTGTADGAWTFGHLMKNIANEPVTGVTTQEFLKEWIKNWTFDQSVGSFAHGDNSTPAPYDNVKARDPLHLLIAPWITKARRVSNPGYSTIITNANWQNEWMTTDENDLVENAPFKLMAIVNRLDLRGNNAFTGGIKNAGETRFIYTLIDPLTGNPPAHGCIGTPVQMGGAPGGTNSALDWVGMNVILEYGNPIDNVCDLKLFAQRWYDLSGMNLGETGYNYHLEEITNIVTAANAGANKNFNRSAINQIRTNEKIFDAISNCFYAAGGIEWETQDWELRQFELKKASDSEPFLHQAVLTNTPVDDRPSNAIISHSFNDAANLIGNTGPGLQGTEGNELLKWIYGPSGTSSNRNRVANGNHNFPEKFLAGKAELYEETSHYFGFDWTGLPTGIPATFSQNSDSPDLLAKKIRHQVSLNTCQGCHGGENKTNFTQMMPRGYGEPANYWDAIPDYVTPAQNHSGTTNTKIDARFGPNDPVNANTINNEGSTFQPAYSTPSGPISSTHIINLNFDEKTGNTYNQIVSPFLIGRLYSSVTGWQDDELDDNIIESPLYSTILSSPTKYKLSDEKLTGLYYVNDPSNQSNHPNTPLALSGVGKGGPYPQLHTQRWGFNDLQRRQEDLCRFIKNACGIIGATTSPTLVTFQQISTVPLPKGGH